MKKSIYIFLLLGILTWSCEQDDTVDIRNSQALDLEQGLLNSIIIQKRP